MNEETQSLTPEELEAQVAEQLPERELMSIIDPAGLRPMPLESTDPGGPEPEPKPGPEQE